MLQRKLTLWTVCLLSLACFSASAQTVGINKVTITADNAYHFGWGSVNGISAKTTPFNVQFPFFNVSVPIPDYHVGHTWNVAPSEIFANGAETYPTTLAILGNHIPIPASGKIDVTTDDYLYITSYSDPKNVPYIDVVVVIDESGSMANLQQFTKTLITDLDAKLTNNGIGIGGQNRYGLVGFGSTSLFFGIGSGHKKGHAHLMGGNSHFGTVAQYTAAVDTLKATGGSEDGYSGINFALDNYPFRPKAMKFIILVTDSFRIPRENKLTSTGIRQDLISKEVTLNAIIRATILDSNKNSAMAIDADNTVFTSSGSSPGGSIGNGQAAQDYSGIAFATGGLVGNIVFINQPGKAASFSESLASQITAQASPRPYRGVIAEVFATSPGKNVFTGTGEWEVYATGVAGNGKGTWSKTNPPSLSEINTQINKANTVSGLPGTSSQGWVNAQGEVLNGAGQPQTSNGYPVNSRGRLEIGENNDSNSGYFGIVNAMNDGTQWIWYNPDPVNVTKPFEYGPTNNGQNDGSNEFLIFRLPVRKLQDPSNGNGSCCDDCCDKFEVQFDKDKNVKLYSKTGNIDLSHFFTVNADYNGSSPAPGSSDWRYVKQVNAKLISSWKTCNGKPQSLGLNFRHPTPVPGWNSKLTSAFFSHEQTWERTTAMDPWFSLNQPFALRVPVSELPSAEAIGFCIKYTFIDSKCQVCEKVVCYNYPLRQPARRSTLEEGKPTLASPEVPRDDTPKTNPSTSGPSRTSPSRTNPSRTNPSRTNPSRTNPSRTNPSRTNPGRTDRPTIRRPVDLRPANLQRGAGRPLVIRPTDAKKDPRKPVVDQPAEGKEAPRKSDREKPATKKPAERKEVEAKGDVAISISKEADDAPANRSVLLKK